MLHDLALLAVFGRRVLAAIEWREHTLSPEIPQGAFRYLEHVDRDLLCPHSFVAAVELTAHLGAIPTLLHDTEQRLGAAGLS
jgi:hypothetical protein